MRKDVADAIDADCVSWDELACKMQTEIDRLAGNARFWERVAKDLLSKTQQISEEISTSHCLAEQIGNITQILAQTKKEIDNDQP